MKRVKKRIILRRMNGRNLLLVSIKIGKSYSLIRWIENFGYIGFVLLELRLDGVDSLRRLDKGL